MEKEFVSLKTLLHDWEDYDIAEYYFCCVVGLTEYDELFDNFREHKGVFCTNNKMSSMLFKVFEQMVEVGILEKNDDSCYRFNRSGKTLSELAYNK